jgi:hypothetical protein
MRKITRRSSCAAVAIAASLLFGVTNPAQAESLFTIGDDDGAADGSQTPAQGAPGPVYFQVGQDSLADFPRAITAENTPLVIQYRHACTLLPGTVAALTVDVARVANLGDVRAQNGSPTPYQFQYDVAVGATNTPYIFEPVNTPDLGAAPGVDGAAAVSNPIAISLEQGELGLDITIDLVQGRFLQLDRVSLRAHCVDDYAKVSGTIGEAADNSGPRWAFEGAVGTLPNGQEIGEISVNYRDLGPTSCDFKVAPNASIVYDGLGGAVFNARYSCSGGLKDGRVGSAVVALTDGSAPGPEERGSIGIWTQDPDLRITGTSGNTGWEVDLETGNVIIDPDTSS